MSVVNINMYCWNGMNLDIVFVFFFWLNWPAIASRSHMSDHIRDVTLAQLTCVANTSHFFGLHRNEKYAKARPSKKERG